MRSNFDGAVPAKNAQFFRSSGTFTVPAGVYAVYVSMIDAGTPAAQASGGSREQGGMFIINRKVAVTPGQQISVLVGAAGTNAYLNDSTTIPATSSGRSSFGSLTTDGGSAMQGLNSSTGQLATPGFWAYGMGGVSGTNSQPTSGCVNVEW